MRQDVVGIHYLRGVAALLVVFHHSILQIGPIRDRWQHIEFGQGGVDIFFFISGFVIFLSWLRHPVAPWEFLLRRLIRVVPLYWLATATLVLAAVSVPQALQSTILTPLYVLQSLLFIPAYSLSLPDRIWPALVPGWSLNFEMFFYSLFAVGLLVTRTRLLLFLACALCGLVAVGALIELRAAPLRTYTDPHLIEFLGGAVLARLYASGKLENLEWLGLLLPCGFALLLLSPSLALPEFGGLGPWALPAGMIVVGALALERRMRAWRRVPVLGIAGDASYATYLSHIFTLGGLRAVWKAGELPTSTALDAWVWLAVSLPICLAIAVVVHRRVEQPLLGSIGRLLRPGQSRGSKASKAGLEPMAVAKNGSEV